jgi:uncharacterized protein YggU (UPF0235/DUF167 family)
VTALHVRVHPGARFARLKEWRGDVLRIDVTEPPERGRANEAVVLLLATALGVTRTDLTVRQGHASRDKRIEVTGIEPAELRARIDRALGESERGH